MNLRSNSVSILYCTALAILCSQGVAQSVIVEDVIIDNDSEHGTSQTSEWYLSAGDNPYAETSVYNNGGSQFTWTANLGNARYDLYAWWTYHTIRSSMIPYRVSVETTLGVNHYEFFVDQGDPNLGGQWNLLGTIGVASRAGDGYVRVTVSSENGQASADAVKFAHHSPEKVWPASACVCDEYYMRAIAIYTSLGGKLHPYSETDTETTVTCDIDGMDQDARFTTVLSGNQTGQSVHLHIFADIVEPSLGDLECGAQVALAGQFYERFGGGSPTLVDVQACRKSVADLCTAN